MKVYLNGDKTHVDPRPYNDILWGLKAHCDRVQSVEGSIWCNLNSCIKCIEQKLHFCISVIYVDVLNYNPFFEEICVGKSNHVSIKEQDLAQKRRVKEMDPITLSSHTCCSLSEIQFGFFSTRSKQGKLANFFVIVPNLCTYLVDQYLVRATIYRNSNFVFFCP